MIEKQLEERMHAALAGEPPLGFDPDELVDRAARRGRQRRATLAAAGAAATVLVLAVVGVVTTGDRGTERPDIGAPTATATPSTAPQPVCQRVNSGTVPPAGFRGSAEILARLELDVPDLIATHLDGRSVVPVDDMVAYDCPPTIGAGYSIAGSANTLALSLVHARATLDLGHDPYTDHVRFRLLRDQPQQDGARIRVYEEFVGESGARVVIRFGPDGMITEVSTARPAEVAEAGLVALVSDPALRFPLPR